MQNKDVLRFILAVFNHKDVKRYLYQRLWMNKKRPIPEVVDLFLFIHNLRYMYLFIHSQPLVWVSFDASTLLV
jgi:uncharacterized membrane protein SpoIIM required for sporulation